jgi:TetR/AcrR family transcriptional regulator, lmrAB and yxaGH operons repressor
VPAALMTKSEILDRLLLLFRQRGYDGASLADIAEATGLGKSSLYHHFPGGKAEMAQEVLAHFASGLQPALEQVRQPGRPQAKLRYFLGVVDEIYESGRLACLLERLCASVDMRSFEQPLRSTFTALLDTFEYLCVEAGEPRSTARARAEDAVVRIQGSLVVGAGTDQPQVFQRALRNIEHTLLEPSRPSRDKRRGAR